MKRIGSGLWLRGIIIVTYTAYYFQYQFILVFQVREYGFYLPFGLYIHLKIRLGPVFRVTALQVLPDHDQGHQEYLYHIGNE